MTARKPRNVAVNTKDADTATRGSYALHLESLIHHPGWKVIEGIMQQNMDRLEDIIITRRVPGVDTKLTDQELDEYRIQHAQLHQTLNLPAQLIDAYKAKGGQEAETLDPYAQTNDPKVERRKKCASTLKEE